MKITSHMRNESIGLFLGCIVLAASASHALAQGSWKTETPMPTARYSAQAASIGNILYVVGGAGVSGDTPVNEAYDTTSDTWNSRAPLPSLDYGRAGRYGGTMGVIDGKLYLVGGWRTSPPLPTGSLQIYDPGTNSWSTGATIPVPPSNLSACSAGGVIGRKLYVLTACNGWSGWPEYFHVYDPDTNTWAALPQANSPHADAAAGVIGGKLYVAGGGFGSRNNVLEVYDPVANTWTTLASMPGNRGNAASGVIDGRLYVAGGEAGSGPVNTVYVYDPTTNTWAIDTPMPTPRTGADGAVIGGELYVVGGSSGSGPLTTLGVFSPTFTVAIDIKPGSDVNPINPDSQGKIAVAILSTATFDATHVDTSTVHFGTATVVTATVEDVNGDGRPDIVLHFNTTDVGIACGDASATLTGTSLSGQLIQGSDNIRTVGCK